MQATPLIGDYAERGYAKKHLILYPFTCDNICVFGRKKRLKATGENVKTQLQRWRRPFNHVVR